MSDAAEHRGPAVITGSELRSAALIVIVQPEGDARWVGNMPLEGAINTLIDLTANLQRQVLDRRP